MLANDVGWHAVPRDWHIWVEWAYNTGCIDITKFDEVGRSDYCQAFSDNFDIAAGYSFYNGPRAAHALDGDATRKECQKVDTFFHQDGEKFDITNMDDSQIMEMIALAKNGTATADFLEAFRALEKRS
jgi:hypothetical protein